MFRKEVHSDGNRDTDTPWEFQNKSHITKMMIWIGVFIWHPDVGSLIIELDMMDPPVNWHAEPLVRIDDRDQKKTEKQILVRP